MKKMVVVLLTCFLSIAYAADRSIRNLSVFSEKDLCSVSANVFIDDQRNKEFSILAIETLLDTATISKLEPVDGENCLIGGLLIINASKMPDDTYVFDYQFYFYLGEIRDGFVKYVGDETKISLLENLRVWETGGYGQVKSLALYGLQGPGTNNNANNDPSNARPRKRTL